MLTLLFSFFTKYTSIIKYGAIGIAIVAILGYGYSVYSDYKGIQIDNETLKGKLVVTEKELSDALKLATDNADKVKKHDEEHKKDLTILNDKHKKDLENNVKFITIRERIKHDTNVTGRDALVAPVLSDTLIRLFGKPARTED